ncbi:MAG: CoB--CoM heterodisulfide reductase iron-sulfur subunit A family protein [Thermoleophilia bacterium]|nr:CoB--CoM heterodisulfide reductase iron-sulfur subunit A family protein [Thermoleophilia bacterium]
MAEPTHEPQAKADEAQAEADETQAKPNEAQAEADEPRVGVYVCYCGGNISDVVDVEAVAAEAAKLPGVVTAKTNMFMCSDPGQQVIADDIAELGVNRVVVASCAPSLHQTTFQGVLERSGLNPYLYENANIREQVSWTHHDRAEATKKASALVSAAVAKASRLEPLEPVEIPAAPAVAVVGGGVAGLRAATDLAKAGLAVTLIEKELTLGGTVARLDNLFPYSEPAEDVLCRLCEEALADPRITVHTGTVVESVEGYVGAFTLHLEQQARGRTVEATPDADSREITSLDWRCEAFRGYGPGEAFADEPVAADDAARALSVPVGAIVAATGFDLYVPPEGEYGYGRLPQVITLLDFIEWLSKQPEGSVPTFNGQPVRAVGFIHCVGSRQVEGVHEPGPNGRINEHCSRVCCTATLHCACDLRDKFPDVVAYEFYQDIRAYGRGHEEHYDRASLANVIFLQYDGAQPPKVVAGEGDDHPVLVSCLDGLTWGEEVEVGVDLLVLAVGMVAADVGNLATSLKLPVSADGFLQEVHPKLRPVEQAVNGVLLAGTCQAPKDVTESCASASAAAAKAYGLLASGEVKLDPYVAHVDPELCEGHAACVEECPVDRAIAMEDYPDGSRKAMVNPAICTGCGACVAVCPTQAIDLSGWTLEAYEAMVDALLLSHSEVSAL